MTDTRMLARKIGQLVRMERETKRLSQARLAEKAGINPAVLSRFEAGRRETTTALIERVLAALGYQLTIDVEPLDSESDAAIAAQSGMASAERQLVAARFDYSLGKLASIALDYRLAGVFGAFLHGVPIDARDLDLAISPDGADGFKAWLGRIPSAMRWSPKHRDFTMYSKDPLEGGPARWWTPGGEIRALVLDKLPEPVVIRLGTTDYPVLPLPMITAHDAQVARVIDRLADQKAG